MIVIAGSVAVRPAKREAALRAARALAEATRAEAGCRQYAFYADLEDPNAFFLFEEWETEEALAKHFQTEHLRAFQQQVPELVAGPPSIRRYVVASASAM
jgi:quinol monooxygenase YgiN